MGDTDKKDILLSVAKNGEVFVNVGEVVDGVGDGSDIGTWQGYFVTMPDAPDETGADQALVTVDGWTKRVTGIRCNRAIAKAGELSPGDSAMLSGGAGRVLCKKETNTVSMFTETDDGTSMVFSMDGSTGEILLAVGSSYFQMKNGEIVISCGAHMLQLDANAVKAIGAAFQSETVATILGQFAALPIPAVNSAIYGPGGVPGAFVGTTSSSVFIAP